jgi:methylmalonyl-CoA mutase N-terminal domain/subunit
MYRGRLWTMRQYAGYGSAAETNARFHSLIAAGQTGLSVAFDLPTQMGIDSDDPRAAGEVGKVGVAIDTIDDMRRLFAGLPLGEVSTSMTINATAAALLLLYELVAKEQGVVAGDIRGTTQNDILKEYAARGTYIYPPVASMRLVTDLFAYCRHQLPAWNTISISGYHIREAGSTAAQEIAFTIANGLAYVAAASAAGLAVDDFAPRLSFFWNAHNGFLTEIAKFRAARRMWARLMRDRAGATSADAMRMRFHTQTAGSSLTAQQPENNIVRTTVQAMSAVLGGTQSLHTNSYDEALSLPTDEAARLALRTQQVIAHESGVADTIDPLAGAYAVEALTDQLENEAMVMLDEIDALGGAVAAIEAGYIQGEIADSAYAEARRVEHGESVVVGVNRYRSAEETAIPVLEVGEEIGLDQQRRLGDWKRRRDNDDVAALLSALGDTAAGSGNVLPPMREALAAGATVGEVSETLAAVFGRYRPST